MRKLNCRGIGLVIDDKALDEKTDDPICLIVSQLADAGIPLLRYRELPTAIQFENLHGLAFLLVDWSLLPSNAGDEAKAAMETAICKFIKEFHAECFAPVFIFSNQDEDEIKQVLKKRTIEVDSPNAYVLVRSKSEMQELDDQQVPKLFAEINKWICATPTIRLLTTWGYDLSSARDKMFVDFYGKSHKWPVLLWNAFAGDGDDPVHGINSVLFDNLRARLRCEFSLDCSQDQKLSDEDVSALSQVLGVTVMLPNDSLPRDQVGCGDLFRCLTDEGSEVYELVVSCDCDCIVRNVKTEDIRIQVLKVDSPVKASDQKMRDRIQGEKVKGKGWSSYKLKQHPASQYLFPLNGKCFCARFKTLEIRSLSELSIADRVGRILPPYITNLRQRLALWNQRVGLPKLPDEMFNGLR